MNARRTAGPGAWALPLLLAATAAHGRGRRRAALIGAPARVTVEPADARLVGRRATRQLIATATYADGSVRDLTRALDWVSLNPEVATVSPKGQVVPKGNGTATIVARGGSVEAKTTVKVEGMDRPAPVSFRNDVIPAFSQAGCNMGACHGTPTGKGGFKLSLRGYLPDQDYITLSREAGGRRINPLAAETSLILRKPLGEIPHEGGLRLYRNTKTYEYLRDWVAEGAQGRPAGPGRRQAGDPARRPRPERPGEDAADRRRRPLRRRHRPRRHADLLLQLVEPRDRRGRRRRPRRLQDARRGRGHRPLPEPRGQRPADAPGRGPRLQGRRGPAGQRRSTGPSSPS